MQVSDTSMSASILLKQIIKTILPSYTLTLIFVFNLILLSIFNTFFAVFVTVTASAI